MSDVLVVDDDEQFGELMVQRLIADGISAELQCGPFGTINRIRRDRPQLVILDINMPAISGQDIVRLLREADGCQGTKLLLMSSMDQEQLDKVKIQVQADAALSKSTNRVEVLNVVKRLLARHPPRGA